MGTESIQELAVAAESRRYPDRDIFCDEDWSLEWRYRIADFINLLGSEHNHPMGFQWLAELGISQDEIERLRDPENPRAWISFETGSVLGDRLGYCDAAGLINAALDRIPASIEECMAGAKAAHARAEAARVFVEAIERTLKHAS